MNAGVCASTAGPAALEESKTTTPTGSAGATRSAGPTGSRGEATVPSVNCRTGCTRTRGRDGGAARTTAHQLLTTQAARATRDPTVSTNATGTSRATRGAISGNRSGVATIRAGRRCRTSRGRRIPA